MYSPIGVFDSGYGGLTILEGMRQALPHHDYLYLGDNARAPYGTRSFEVVYQFTLQAVKRLFAEGCQLVVLGCNTASAKALRTIQQRDLPKLDPSRRVLGIIRPTVEHLAKVSASGHIGYFATQGTVASNSYEMEMAKLCPQAHVTGQAAPMWVPLVENHESDGPGADFFVAKYASELLNKDPQIDTALLACTHFPLLINKITQAMPKGINIVTQGEIVGASLADYLHRHPDMDARISRNASCQYLTTESASKFAEMGSLFLRQPISATTIHLN